MKRVWILSMITWLSVANFALGATITAVQSGNWSAGANWDSGTVPAEGDYIIIPSGITITVDGNYDYMGPGITVIHILSGGILDGSGIGFGFNSAAISLDNADGDKIIVDDGGAINPEVIFRFGSTFGPPDVVVSDRISWADDSIAGPSTIEDGVLPVELLFFAARAEDQHVALSWATASEENFDYFAIERSANGQDFFEIGRVNGVGESDERVDYDFTDEFPLTGTSYYRLRSVDFDGYTEIFDYQMVVVDDLSKDFMVYPNPITNGQFSLQTNFNATEDVSLVVYNSMGNIEFTTPVDQWLTNYSLPALRPGTYLFRLITADTVLVKRVLIR